MKPSSASGFVNHILVYFLVAICGTGSLGLGKVWLSHQISLAANANKVLQSRIAEVQRRLEEMSVEVAAEEDPAVLARRNQAWRLGLTLPADGQVRRVAVDPVLRLAALHNRALFGERPVISFLNGGGSQNGSARRPASAGRSLSSGLVSSAGPALVRRPDRVGVRLALAR
jgi:hypothetical protein